MEAAAWEHIQRERDGYVERALAELRAAVTNGERQDGASIYGAVSLTAILGNLAAAVTRWVLALSAPWGDAWVSAMLSALEGLPARYAKVPELTIAPSDYDPLSVSAGYLTDYDQKEVIRVVTEGVNAGRSPSTIAEDLRQSSAFTRARALRIARTEVVRSQTGAIQRRWARAASEGLPVEQEWLTAGDLVVRDSHVPMEGKRARVGAMFTLPSGRLTPGPGLSGDPSEDVNCRCALAARVPRAAAPTMPGAPAPKSP